jgi:MYXO-CTERM domain-containing protein
LICDKPQNAWPTWSKNMIAKRPLAVALAVAMLAMHSAAVLAQDAAAPASPVVTDTDNDNDNDGMDLGWLGLLGLAGLLGLRGRRHDDHVRTANTRTTTGSH